MRKSVKIPIVIASAMIGAGLLFMTLAIAFGGVDLFLNKKSNLEYKTEVFENIEVVNIVEISNDVKLVKSADDKVKVTYAVGDDFNYFVEGSEGTLQIEFNDFRRWYNYIFNFSSEDAELLVELPEKALAELNVRAASADIEATEVNSLLTNLETTSGDIKAGGSLGVLLVSSTSGDVILNPLSKASSVMINVTSGDVEADASVEFDFNVTTSSGDVAVNNITAEKLTVNVTSGTVSGKGLKLSNLSVETTSGDITLDDVICSNLMNAKSSSGSLKLKSVDAESYNLSTTSGSVMAEILSPKMYNAKSTSGSIDTPDIDESATGILRAQSVSGSIKIKLAE